MTASRTKKMPKYLPTGSISSGTLRAIDVVPDLLWAAERWVSMSRRDRNRVRAISTEVTKLIDTAYDGDVPINDDAEDRLGEIWYELEDIMGMYAPPGHYVGSHPGDGADIGVWPCDEIPCVCPKVGPVTPEMLDDAAAADGPGDIVFELSDHGNLLVVWTLSVGKTRKWNGKGYR